MFYHWTTPPAYLFIYLVMFIFYFERVFLLCSPGWFWICNPLPRPNLSTGITAGVFIARCCCLFLGGVLKVTSGSHGVCSGASCLLSPVDTLGPAPSWAPQSCLQLQLFWACSGPLPLSEPCSDLLLWPCSFLTSCFVSISASVTITFKDRFWLFQLLP